jgi:hypothetical protein
MWPKGRMVCVEADEQGEFTMMPVIPPGTTLRINALTKRTGWVKVEVVGGDSRTLDTCNPIIGDQAWAQVTWKDATDLGVEPGGAVTLRIQMYQAKLYGLQFD